MDLGFYCAKSIYSKDSLGFKSTQEIENKEMGCVGAVIVIVLILWLIGSLLPDKNEEGSNNDKPDTVEVDKRKKLQKQDTPTIASKENKERDIQDTTIDFQLMIEEDFDEELEIELEEYPCEPETTIKKINSSPINKEGLPESPTSNEDL